MPRPRVLIFDLDEALLDRRGAWQYAVEEGVAAVCGQRVNARELVAEYRLRPWSQALAVLVADRGERARCEETCAAMYERSAMKRLLVHEGMGMALDNVRARGVEIGTISREPHRIAMKQIESTGLDRFLSVLSPTPGRSAWAVADRIAECLSFVARRAEEAVYVGVDTCDLEAGAEAGLGVALATYAGCAYEGFRAVESPEQLVELITGP